MPLPLVPPPLRLFKEYLYRHAVLERLNAAIEVRAPADHE
jgi:hypothetical protein